MLGDFLTVAAKTTLTTLFVVAAAFLVVGWVLVRDLDRAALRERRAQALLVARTLAGSFVVPLSQGEHEALQRQIDEMMELPERFPDLARLAVVDSTGRIVAHSEPVRFGERWDESPPAEEQVFEDLSGPKPLLVLRVPIETVVRFGTLEVALSVHGPGEAAAASSRLVVAALVVSMVLLVGLLSFLLNRLIVRPMRRLAGAVASFDGAQATLAVPLDGPDEVQVLMRAFDEMALRLHDQTERLEHKVEERTRELKDAYDRLTVANRQLQELAVTDGLTGLSNRRAFSDRLGLEVERSRRQGQPLSLLLFDIDRFKQLNDTLGHLEGDAALVLLAGILREGRRASDLVARYGGEEFVLLMPDTPYEDALAVAERLRQAVEDAHLPGDSTVSAGVASLPPHAQDAHELVARADEALYLAKARGRNRVEGAAPYAPLPARAAGGAG